MHHQPRIGVKQRSFGTVLHPRWTAARLAEPLRVADKLINAAAGFVTGELPSQGRGVAFVWLSNNYHYLDMTYDNIMLSDPVSSHCLDSKSYV